jgi:protein-S-isoprenylcysteine O-methyltransferase Ste14
LIAAFRHGIPLPPVFFCSIVGGAVFLERSCPVAFRPSWLPVLVPAALAVFASTLILWAVVLFQRGKTPIHPGATPEYLLLGGPFRFSRNPIYLGLVLLLLAGSTFFDSIWPLVGIPIFVLLLQVFVLPGEEQSLEKVFGASYLAYKSRVRRWL